MLGTTIVLQSLEFATFLLQPAVINLLEYPPSQVLEFGVDLVCNHCWRTNASYRSHLLTFFSCSVYCLALSSFLFCSFLLIFRASTADRRLDSPVLVEPMLINDNPLLASFLKIRSPSRLHMDEINPSTLAGTPALEPPPGVSQLHRSLQLKAFPGGNGIHLRGYSHSGYCSTLCYKGCDFSTPATRRMYISSPKKVHCVTLIRYRCLEFELGRPNYAKDLIIAYSKRCVDPRS